MIKEGVIGMRRKYGALFCLGLSAVCAVAAVEGPLVLSNQYLRVEVDQATGRFSIAGNPDGQVMIKDGHPQLLSTSGHILQGMLDVRREAWDDQAMVLSGVSKVVANDSYELRVVVPVGEHSWRALPPATQEGPNIRLAFTNTASAEVAWQIKFERGAVKPATVVAEAPSPANAVTVAAQKRPASPPAPDVYLDSLKPVCTSNEWRIIRVNKSVMGNPLTLEGKAYGHGLGCHANALLVYSVPAGAGGSWRSSDLMTKRSMICGRVLSARFMAM